MKNELAETALARALAGTGEQEKGYCQRWVRQCLQAIYGSTYDRWMRPSAKETAKAFLADPPRGCVVIQSVSPSRTRLGDLLFATTGHGGLGHVSIRVLGNRVAENSVRTTRRTHGAIGFHPLGELDFNLIVRLPPDP